MWNRPVCLAGDEMRLSAAFDNKILFKNPSIILHLTCSSDLHNRGREVICPSLNFLAFPPNHWCLFQCRKVMEGWGIYVSPAAQMLVKRLRVDRCTLIRWLNKVDTLALIKEPRLHPNLPGSSEVLWNVEEVTCRSSQDGEGQEWEHERDSTCPEEGRRTERRFLDVVREELKVAGLRDETLYSLPTCVFFNNSMSLREISENVKLAREYALLGNYSSASVLYHGLLEQIKKYLYTLRDSSFQQRWQQVNISSGKRSSQTCWTGFWSSHASQLWQEISEENGHVQDIMSTLENFQLGQVPAAPSNHHHCDVRPVQVDLR